MKRRVRGLALLLATALLPAGAAHAERLENQVAVFAALDKVTARISTLPIELGKTVEFGALKVTPPTAARQSVSCSGWATGSARASAARRTQSTEAGRPPGVGRSQRMAASSSDFASTASPGPMNCGRSAR